MCNCGKRRAAAAPAAPRSVAAAAPAAPRSVAAAAPAAAPAAPRSVAPAAAPRFINGRRIRSYMLPRRRPEPAGIDPKIWGPSLWRILHTAAERVPVASPAWTAVVTVLQTSLPCQECTGHYVAWVGDAAHRVVEGETDMRAWWLALHNDVNRRNRKGVWDAAAVTTLYGSATAAALEPSMATLVGKIGECALTALRTLLI
jgi:hypothetical protein